MNVNTFLLRQIVKNWIRNERVTSQAFNYKEISFYHGDMISPKDAWDYHTQCLNLRSIGVVKVKVSECTQEGVTTIHDGIGFPEHVSGDCSGLTNKQRRDAARKLAKKANARGWQHNPYGKAPLVSNASS